MRSTGQGRCATRTCGEQTCHQVPAGTPHNRVLRMKAEDELIQVGLKMLLAHAVVRAEDPRLEVREHEVDHRQRLLGLLRIAAEHDRLVVVPQRSQAVVTDPAIGDDVAVRLDALDHERFQRLRAAVLDHT